MRASLAASLLYYPVTRLAGEPIRELVNEYRLHDRMCARELEALQHARLREIVTYARACTEFYGSASPDESSRVSSGYPALDGISLLDKAVLRRSPSKLAAPDFKGRCESKTTSGSTGHPVTVSKNSDALARERAATWRAYGWAGISVAAPQALLWGRPYTVTGRIRAHALDFFANRRRLSMFGVTEESFERYQSELIRFKPDYVYGYVSAVLAFVKYLYNSGRRLPPSTRCIITTSEMLDVTTRRLLTELTGLPVYNEYGCGEVGSIAHDCERGRLHIMSDNLVLECLPVEGGTAGLGEFVVTDLFNRAMPLIRYRLGDLGNLSEDRCECGRPYPVINRIVGRAYDTIIDAEGRSFHPEAVLYAFEALRSRGVRLPPFQAVQRAVGELVVVFEATEPVDRDLMAAIRQELQKSLGAALGISFETTPRLARERSGKLRVVKRVRTESESS